LVFFFDLDVSQVSSDPYYRMEFVGSWRLQHCRNFDQFLRACGVNLILAKLAVTLTPTETISFEGDPETGQWTIKFLWTIF